MTLLVINCLLSSAAISQRRIPADRSDALQGEHIVNSPTNVRSNTFYLGMTEDHEALWNRFEENRHSMEFRLAQTARVGCNSVRLWSSLCAYWRARLRESPPQSYGHWARVAEF